MTCLDAGGTQAWSLTVKGRNGKKRGKFAVNRPTMKLLKETLLFRCFVFSQTLSTSTSTSTSNHHSPLSLSLSLPLSRWRWRRRRNRNRGGLTGNDKDQRTRTKHNKIPPNQKNKQTNKQQQPNERRRKTEKKQKFPSRCRKITTDTHYSQSVYRKLETLKTKTKTDKLTTPPNHSP